MVTVNDTIAAGKAWLLARIDKGEHCPLCGQHAKMYRRKVNSGMARSLIHIYRIGGKGWVHVRAIGAASREEGKLAYWGLLEEQTGVGLHGGRAGYWRVTDKGEAFLKAQLNIPKYAKVYDGKVQGFDFTEMVNIKDALGTKFNYQDLMQGV
jgi:hypothetical protein